ncbi:hypothetical protein GCM10007962_18980 [Yeosuana aromativorans]|uniref:Uncharacterized protein n=1 Tax=Yeosuana aromativorans TaxID=288019 RepID=A0A8J3BIY4_9FLAO|nr:hypothetical protein [Yeosuana aromativorans]GGK24917.1 hypothetical protein GCM10007962_18980 [Yeosuana aromativorans]
MELFKKNRYYIKLFLNRVEIKDLTNGKSISEKSKVDFNNDRILVAEFEKAENFIKKVFTSNKLSTRNSVGIIQQMEMSENGLSEVEKRILIELFSRIGINEIHIDQSLTNLSEKKLAEY